MPKRAYGDAPRCTGVWPNTGNLCKNRPRPGVETCAAHDPAGDQRRPPPPDEVRCTASTKETGQRCRLEHEPGVDVCFRHGGSARQVRKVAQQYKAMEEAKAMVATYGLPIDVTPDQAILDEVHRTAGHVAWLEQQIRALGADELIWGITREKDGGEDRGTTFEAVPHAYLKLYQAERAHLAKVSADAIRIGIEARQVKLAEQQGALVAQALRAILDDLQLTAAQRAKIPEIVPMHLRALALLN